MARVLFYGSVAHQLLGVLAIGRYTVVMMTMNLRPKLKVDIVVLTAKKDLYTSDFDDDKVFLYNVENVVHIRTGEEGYAALCDPEA